jgi:hypothetical protein
MRQRNAAQPAASAEEKFTATQGLHGFKLH